MELLKWIEKWLGGGANGTKRLNTFRWLLLVGLVGLAIMTINSFVSIKEIDPTGGGPPANLDEQVFTSKVKESKFQDYEDQYASSLKDILEKIVGVGEVDVLVTIDSTEEMVVQKNTTESQQVTDEKDVNGSSRHISNISRNGEIVLYEVAGGKSPIVLKTIKPKIRGVLIVAKGAQNLTVKQLIIEAVEKGLDVLPHRISVVPRKQ